MSIRKHKTDPNKWIIDYYPEGRKGKRCRLTFEGAEAEAVDAEAELRRMHISTGDRTNPPIRRILPEYLEWHKIHRAARTHQDVLLSLKWLLPIFGALPVSRITQAHFTAYKKSRSGRSPATINKEIHYLMGIINWMADHTRKYAEPLPFRPEKLKYRRPVPQIPHPTDIRAFLAHFQGIKLAMVLLMYMSGLRFSEVAGMLWTDINWRAKTIRIKGKGDKWRLADLPDEAAEILKAHKKLDGWVFENPKTGRPYGSLKTTCGTASRKVGVKISPHLLRHACATYLLESEGDLRLVQTVLGHSSVVATEFYTHVTAARVQSGLKKSRDYIRQLEEDKS